MGEKPGGILERELFEDEMGTVESGDTVPDEENTIGIAVTERDTCSRCQRSKR